MKRTGKKCLQAVLPAILLCAPAMASSARSISRIRGGKVAVLSEIEAHDAIREIGEEKSRDPFAVFGDSRQSSKKDIPSAQSDVLDFLRENDLLQPQGETICEVSGDIKSSNLGRKEFAHASAYYHCHTSFGTYNTNTYPTTSSVRCATMWNGTWHNPAGVDPSPPSFQDISIPTKTATSFDVYVDLSKSSTLYAVLLLPTAPAPTSAQVKAGTDGSGSAALQTKTQAVTVDPYTATLSFTGVDTVNNKYVVYLVGDDGSQLTATPGVANTAFLNGTVFTSTNYYVWPHIEASDNGNFYVAYWDGANNRYTVSKWNEGSMTWGAYTAFSNSATGTYQLSWGGYERAAFAVSSPNATTDNLHLVFNAGTTNMAVTNDPYYGLHNGTGIGTTDGTGWTFNKAVDDVNYADNFDIFYDSSGKVHITYELYDYVNDTVCTNDYYRLRYVKNTAGAFPQSYTTVQTNQGCDSLELQDTYIVRESGGLTHVFYGSEQDPWHTGYYYRSSADNFASATLLLDSCAVASCPSDPSNTNRIYWSIGDVVMDAGDKVHMVYSDETNGKAYYRTNKTGSWVTTEITTPGLSGLQAIDLQVIDNTVYIAMNSSAGYYIKAYDGSTWYDGTRFNLDGYLRQFAIETVNNRVMLISEISSNPYKVNYHTGLLSDYVTTFSNSAPTIGGTSAGQAVNDTSTIAPFSSVTIGDGDGDNVTTTITLDSNAKGVFTPASLTASGFTGTGPYSLALTTPANAQTAIRQLVYNPTDNRVAAGSSETTTFTIAVNDGTDTTNDSTTTVISTSMNDAPMITSNGGGATASTSINENTTAVITVTASDVDPGTTLTYSISGGIDQALFSINSSSGALVFASAPNYESPTDSGTNNIYDVQVTATDNGPGLLTDVQDIAVTVNNVNENPVITSNGGGTTASVNAPENQTGVTTVTATDQDSGDTLTYSITGGADQALFNINSSTGVLTFASAPNYESPTDSGANGVYDVQITVTDDGSGTLTDVQAIAVTVTNINEAPVITSNGGAATASTSINENSTAVTTVTATDVDTSDTLTYSISGGVDQALFSINSSTGALTFASAPNYESPTDSGANNVYDVQVTVTDNGTGTLTDVQDIAVTVNNINENPVITSNGGGTTASVNAPENQTGVTTVTATDQDSGDTLTYSITGGADQALFNINSSTGVLTFASAPNYESPTDSGANGVYDVQITVTDDGSGTLTDVQAIAVTVTNINEAPVITSNGGGATASTSVNENSTAVTTVTATDVDTSDTLTYSISGGIDQALFSINSSTGALTFASAPNYESPTDSGANNVYDVQVTVTDNGTGTLTDGQDIAVTVNNINENPVITSNGGGTTASVNAPENQTGVTTVTATDQDSGDTLTYSITGGADQALFNINSSTGVLTFASAPNYESPTDSGANGVYDVQITVTDDGSGTLTDVQAIAVTVTNINEAPVITSNGGGATASTSVNENSTAVTTVTATDVDTSDTLTYSISGGIDQALFSINSSTGALTFASAPNYESPADFGANNVYNVQVTVTDNGTVNLTDVQAIAVTVNNINENPVITSNGGGVSASVNAPENQTAVTTVTATDQDTGDTLTYSITGGADQALFDINSSTGVLTFASAPNYESPADSGSNGIYDVQVTVTDNGTGNLTDVQAIAVTVTNANEAPVITSNGGSATAAVNAPENQTSVTTVTATDVDTSDTLTYSLSGGADQTLFSINSSTGALTFNSAPDYENPTDFDSNNVYDVQVTVTDDGPGTLTDVQAIAVTVTDANDAPVITSNGGGASASVNAAENQTAVTTVTATDVDAGDTLTYSISGGADQAGFNINPSTGVLTFASAPDYENPTDAGANNVYDVQITVTDDGSGSLTDVQAIAVIVTNANEAPVITSNGGGATATLSAVENQTSVTTVTATDVDAGDTLTYSISGGADAIRFFINVNSGALSFTTAPDYENPTDSGADNVYDVQVTVTDNGTGALTDTQAIAVTVTDANDAPVFTGTPRITGAVRLKGTARLTDTGTSDPDSDPVTLSYQWQIDSADVAGAITPVYAIQPTELGKTLTCTITADDGNGGISNHTTQGVVIKDRFPWLDIIPGLVSPNKMTGGN